MKILIVQSLIFIFFCVSQVEAGEVTYFSPDGNKISRKEYEIIVEKRIKNIDGLRLKFIEDLQKQKDKYGRPLYDSNGRNIYYTEIEGVSDGSNKNHLTSKNNHSCPKTVLKSSNSVST